MKQGISLLPAAAGISACLAAAACLLTVCSTDRLMFLSAGSMCFGVLSWIRSGSQAGQEPFTSGEMCLGLLTAGAMISAGSSLPAVFSAAVLFLLLFQVIKTFMLKKNSREHLIFGLTANAAVLVGGLLLFPAGRPVPDGLLSGIFCSQDLSGKIIFSVSLVLCTAALLWSPYFTAAERDSREAAELGISTRIWVPAGYLFQSLLAAITVLCTGLLAGPALLALFFFGIKYSSAAVPVFFSACFTFLVYTVTELAGISQEYLLLLIPAAYIETLTAEYFMRNR